MLIALKRKTNLSNGRLAHELGLKDSMFSLLINGKRRPKESLRRLVEKMLSSPQPEEGMRSVVIELPEQLYYAAHDLAKHHLFPDLDQYFAQLIRNQLFQGEAESSPALSTPESHIRKVREAGGIEFRNAPHTDPESEQDENRAKHNKQ